MTNKILGLIPISIGLGLFITIATARVVVEKMEPTLPDISHLSTPVLSGPTTIKDTLNNTVATFSNHNSDPINVEKMPILLKQAFISAEDKNFYIHNGLDYYGILRALLSDLSGNHMAGASTITQQVIKNMVTGNDRTVSRKIKEALLARRLEKILTKNEILNIYLNTIWLGNGAYGVPSASKVWFDKDIYHLNPAEIAFLAALPKGPAIIDPIKHPDRAKSRRHYVLNRMCEDKYISCSQVSYWDAQPLPVPHIVDTTGMASDWYEESVRRYVVNHYGAGLLYSGGMIIEEWKNPLFQIIAENALNNGISNYIKRHRGNDIPNGSVIIMDSNNGHILAEVGGREYSGGFDRALQSNRQIGSIAKSIISIAALSSGYKPDTDVMDVPIHIDDGFGHIWSPGADGGDGMGVISLTKALAESRNQAFVRIGYELGFENIYNAFYKYGLYAENTKLLPASMLGAIETTPMNVAVAYSRLINNGQNIKAEFIKKITDKTGNIIEQSPDNFDVIHLNDDMNTHSDEMRKMLHEVVSHGTAYMPFKNMDLTNIGGKTGTSNDVMDSWFAGFKDNYVIVVNIGFDNPKSLGSHEFGSTVAAPIASEIMQKIDNR